MVVVALLGASIYEAKLRRIAETAPTLAIATSSSDRSPSASSQQPGTITLPLVSVIIPAYNEADNIEDCILSVLQGTPPSAPLEVWVLDDQSSDDTLAIAQTLQQTLNDPRLRVLAGKARPDQQTWMGKNWACTQAVEHARGAFLLFLDADVRLKPGAIVAALEFVQENQIDLLTLCPEVVCGCLAEWLVQPWMMSLLMAGFAFNEVNDPHAEAAFAAGMFMFFRRTAYEQVGGHQAVADQAVEDVELARRLKLKGLKLYYAIGANLASVRMYRSLAGVWEGWTKNWHLGSRRSLYISLLSATIMLWVCVLPWFGLVALLYQLETVGLTPVNGLAIALAVTTIAIQYRIRCSIERVAAIPPRYWWLTGIGGALVAAITIVSVIKTETGWGWTWRGRSLQLPNAGVRS
ncbi:glycosyl transferase [Stenomitos frigidus ULC18]|uniref:Glycosyl transferase n=1 Tax=Stenomitos frigidus ULC18 TaxID=2107698 RepID=A0A2T1E5U4_9CYAN|nr:glycosyl transferase [Stenomitos frigidus ULC18]